MGMSMFSNMLKSGDSLFTSNVEALDFDFIPKPVMYREKEQQQVANCIKPVFQRRNGKNILLYGKPGVGKTVAVKQLLREIEEETDELFPIYINCWQFNTSFKIMAELCDQLGYKFTQNKNTEELSKVVTDIINKNIGAALVFDEIDKCEDFNFLYTLLENVYRKSIVLITNFKEWINELDDRIRSRLLPDKLEFTEYTAEEVAGILKQRAKFAFVTGCWDDSAFDLVTEKTTELRDVRTGLFLLREAAQSAEDRSSKKIEKEDAEKAVEKLDDFSQKDNQDLGEMEREILEIIKENSGKKIGDLFKLFEDAGATCSYKTFQRKIKKLEQNNFISVEKIAGGAEGKTSIIKFGSLKKLTDF